MIKIFLEDFKKPEYKELDPSDQGGLAKTYSGINKRGSKFFRKTESYQAIFRNLIIHEIFTYINKGAGKTIIPIPKHFEYEVKYDGKYNFEVYFTSSSSPHGVPKASYPPQTGSRKKIDVLNDFLNTKFMIPFMLIGTNDFHGGNKILNLNKLSAYGIDFSSGEQFRKSYVLHNSREINSRGKIPKKINHIKYAHDAGKFDKFGGDQIEKDKLHRYYQMLFFYHNFLKNNKRNFKTTFDDTTRKFIKDIQKEYLKINKEEKGQYMSAINAIYKDRIESIQTIAKNDYGTFIRNLIKVVAWTEDQMKQIDKIVEERKRNND